MTKLGLLCLATSMLACSLGMAQSPDVQIWRNLYRQALDAEGASAMSLALANHLQEQPEDVMAQGFYATAMLMTAQHAWNPLEKLELFQSWKPRLERAIEQAPKESNADLLFLRIGVQAHVPALLDYRDDMASDRLLVEQAMREGYWSIDPEHERFVSEFLTYLETNLATHD
jgi:hypothetical protein